MVDLIGEPVGPPGDGGLVRLRLDISYDGTDFSGWARQPARRTVQGLIEDALTRQPPGVCVPRSVVVAGRTDAGVHAIGQVAHVDVVVDEAGVPDLARMQRRWNRYLPADVRVLDARVASPGFDARFSAVRRHYRYRVSDAAWGVDPLRRHDTLAWGRSLSLDAMNSASHVLLGLNDFAAFCKRRAGGTTIRELQRFAWRRFDEHLIEAEVSADAFCHSMVRSLVGAVLEVGADKRDETWPAELLRTGARHGYVAPPHALTLVAVDYPPDDQLSARAEQTRALRTS